jgi:hypothetical protein
MLSRGREAAKAAAAKAVASVAAADAAAAGREGAAKDMQTAAAGSRGGGSAACAAVAGDNPFNVHRKVAHIDLDCFFASAGLLCVFRRLFRISSIVVPCMFSYYLSVVFRLR